MHVFRFREFGLKTPIHAPKLGVLGENRGRGGAILRRYEQIWVEIALFERGVGHFERKFQGEGAIHQRILASEN